MKLGTFSPLSAEHFKQLEALFTNLKGKESIITVVPENNYGHFTNSVIDTWCTCLDENNSPGATPSILTRYARVYQSL